MKLGRQWDQFLGIVRVPDPPRRLLSILIPSITERFPLLMRLLWQLQPQVEKYHESVEVLIFADSRSVPIGTKIDALTEMAEGRFATVVADDDLVAPNYVDVLVAAIKNHPDVDAISFEFALHKKGEGVFKLIEEISAVGPGWTPKTPGVLHTWPSDKAAIRTDIRRSLRHEPLFDNEDERYARLIHSHLKNVDTLPYELYEIWQDPETAADRKRRLG